MTHNINTALFPVARHYRGLSQAATAQSAGLPQGYYSRLENDILDQPISDEVLKAVARALSFPPSFFRQTDAIPGLPHSVHGTARPTPGTAPEWDMRRLHAALTIHTMHIRRLLRGLEVTPELILPKIDVVACGGPEAVARLVRRGWQIPDGPIANLTELCELAGIIVIVCEIPEQVDGLTVRMRDMPPLVFINSLIHTDRRRQTLAHELGHIIMHQFPTVTMEEEADHFASALLLHTDTFWKWFIGPSTDIAKIFHHKRCWRVPASSIIETMKRRRIIPAAKLRTIIRQMEENGITQIEPSETTLPIEPTTLDTRLLSIHLNELKYSWPDLSRLLCMSEPEARALYGRPDLVPAPSPVTVRGHLSLVT